jgi:hypothetical protein
MYKATVKDFYNIHENLASFIAEHGDVALGKVGIVLHYNFRVIHDALTEFIAERDRIINANGTTNEEGTIYIDTESEDSKDAVEAINKLENLEIELSIMFIDLEDLYDAADKLPNANMSALIWMTNEYQESIEKKEEAVEVLKKDEEASGDDTTKSASGRYTRKKK